MYHSLKHTLINHLQILDHNFMCLNLSIVDWNEIQVRRLESLNLSIDCLRFTAEGFISGDEPLPSIIEDDICSQIVTIADIAQLFLHQCAEELSQDASAYLQEFIFALKRVHEDIEAYTVHTTNLSA